MARPIALSTLLFGVGVASVHRPCFAQAEDAIAPYSTTTIPLSPGPSFYYSPRHEAHPPTQPIAEPAPMLINARLSIGDLNGDQIQDFVFANQLGYMEVYAFTNVSYTTPATGSPFLVRDPAMSTAVHCGNIGSAPLDWRRRSMGTTHDDVLIYDIDLDGINEIICTDLVTVGTSAEVGIAVIDVVPAGSTWTFTKKVLATNYASFHGVSPNPYGAGDVPITECLSPQDRTGYFACVRPSGQNRGIKLTIGNVRGTPIPQDILVHGTDFGHSVYGYSTGSGSNPDSLDVLMHVKPAFTSGLVNPGEPGHAGYLRDLDADGKDELVGRHMFSYVPGQAAGNGNIQNGKFLWALQDMAGNNTHPDSVTVGEMMQTVLTESGASIPAPGVELAVAPQIPNVGNGGGPWIFRGIQGHHRPNPAAPFVWPRKVLNYDPACEYYTSPTASQHNGPAGSGWDAMADAFAPLQGAPQLGGTDPQQLLLGNFTTTGGLDLVTTPKGLPRNIPAGWGFPFLYMGHAGFVIGGEPNLTARATWFNFGRVSPTPDTLRNGPGYYETSTIDWEDTRDTLEVYSVLTGLISQLSSYVPGTHNDPFHKTVWKLGSGPLGTNQLLYSLYPSNSQANGAETWYGDSQGADLFGDNREEYVIFRCDATFNPRVTNARLLAVSTTSTVASRAGQPSPTRFIEYRARHGENDLDYSSFGGVRLYTTVLPAGKAGQPYGDVLDQAYWTNASTPARGAMLVPEGGQAPYTITQIGGVRHANLALVPRPIRNTRSGHAIVPQYNGAVAIEGTPTEAGTRRLRFRVTDANNVSSEHDLWLTVAEAAVPVGDPVPVIAAGSFGGAYLSAGTPQNITLRAFVLDQQGPGDVLGVALLDIAGNNLGISLLDNGVAANGDAVAGDGIFSTIVPNVSLPPNFALQVRMVAVDAAGHQSLPWPYLAIDGSAGKENPAFDVALPPSSQGAANTPRIDFVYLPPHSIPAAERSNATGAQPIYVQVGAIPAGSTVTSAVARIRHHFGDVAPYDVPLAQVPGNNFAWAGTFVPPAGHFGYGYHSVNVRITVTSGANQYVSDWWPSLMSH